MAVRYTVARTNGHDYNESKCPERDLVKRDMGSETDEVLSLGFRCFPRLPVTNVYLPFEIISPDKKEKNPSFPSFVILESTSLCRHGPFTTNLHRLYWYFSFSNFVQISNNPIPKKS